MNNTETQTLQAAYIGTHTHSTPAHSLCTITYIWELHHAPTMSTTTLSEHALIVCNVLEYLVLTQIGSSVTRFSYLGSQEGSTDVMTWANKHDSHHRNGATTEPTWKQMSSILLTERFSTAHHVHSAHNRNLILNNEPPQPDQTQADVRTTKHYMTGCPAESPAHHGKSFSRALPQQWGRNSQGRRTNVRVTVLADYLDNHLPAGLTKPELPYLTVFSTVQAPLQETEHGNARTQMTPAHSSSLCRSVNYSLQLGGPTSNYNPARPGMWQQPVDTLLYLCFTTLTLLFVYSLHCTLPKKDQEAMEGAMKSICNERNYKIRKLGNPSTGEKVEGNQCNTLPLPCAAQFHTTPQPSMLVDKAAQNRTWVSCPGLRLNTIISNNSPAPRYSEDIQLVQGQNQGQGQVNRSQAGESIWQLVLQPQEGSQLICATKPAAIIPATTQQQLPLPPDVLLAEIALVDALHVDHTSTPPSKLRLSKNLSAAV